MRLIQQSELNTVYEFIEISINQKLGILPRLSLIHSLVKKIKSIKPDIIHISGLQLHGFYAALSAKLSRTGKILLVIRGSSSESTNFHPLKRFIVTNILEPLTISFSDKIYAVSSVMANKNQRLMKSRKYIGCIHNPAPIVDNIDKYSIRSELNIDASDFLCVYTGRVVVDKGIGYLMDAFNLIDNKLIKLIIVGDGPDKEKYMTEYSDLIRDRRVFFIGERDNVLSILLDCNAYVFPTLHENLSNSLLEAGALGLPIIATKVGGNTEIIENNSSGVLINPQDHIDIKKAIDLLYSNVDFRNHLSLGVKEQINMNFSQIDIFRRLNDVYKSLL
jgi:glycosyltransferase involved in cell wall biosynthesis